MANNGNVKNISVSLQSLFKNIYNDMLKVLRGNAKKCHIK